MRGHVDPKGSIAVHEGPIRQYVLYVISGTGKMTLNDKGGEQIGEITYKPDDVIVCSARRPGTVGSMAMRHSNSSASICRCCESKLAAASIRSANRFNGSGHHRPCIA